MDEILSESGRVVEDITTGSSIDLSGVITELQEINKLLQENQKYNDEILTERFDFWVEKLENSGFLDFDLKSFFESFFEVCLEYQSVIMGILIFALAWFVIRLVYKLFRIFI